jgi:hypothetical protein
MAFHSYYVHIRTSFHISCTDENMGCKFASLICCLDTVYFNQCYTIFTIMLIDESICYSHDRSAQYTHEWRDGWMQANTKAENHIMAL